MSDRLLRVQYRVYETREAALAAGYPDAEFGTWQTSPRSTRLREGWIALEYEGGEEEAQARNAAANADYCRDYVSPPRPEGSPVE